MASHPSPRNTVPWAIAAFAVAALSACGGSDRPAASAPAASAAPSAPATATATAASDPRAEAQQIFSTRCFTCHGMQGKGDGPGSAGLTPKPRDLTDRAWQASVTDEHIEKIIKYGGAAVGKSLAMPPNPDLVSKDEVIRALRAHVRSLGTK